MRFAPGGRGHGRQRDKGSVVEVHFQTEHLGWNTDDLRVVGLRPATSQFWFLCRMFADKGRDARWLTRIRGVSLRSTYALQLLLNSPSTSAKGPAGVQTLSP